MKQSLRTKQNLFLGFYIKLINAIDGSFQELLAAHFYVPQSTNPVIYVAEQSPSRTFFRNFLGDTRFRTPTPAIAFPRVHSETQRVEGESDARVHACCQRRHSTAVPRVHHSPIPAPYRHAKRPIPTTRERPRGWGWVFSTRETKASCGPSRHCDEGKDMHDTFLPSMVYGHYKICCYIK